MSDQSEDLSGMDGGTLRTKLEESIGREKNLAGRLAVFEAANVISEKGYTYVQPEDLASVPLDQIAEKAEALQAERAGVFEGVIRRQLESAGVSGDDLEKQVADFTAGKAVDGGGQVDPNADAISRIRSIGGGGTVPARNPETMSTMEKLQAGLTK